MDIQREFAGIEFEHPIMNGPGYACKTIPDVEVLAQSLSSGVLVGAITVEARDGNPGETSNFDIPYLSVNSLGMPNGGLKYYEDALPKMVEIAHRAEKPLGVNVAGFSVREFVDLAVFADICGVDWIELNLSCPNAHDKKSKGRIFCFDLNMIDEICWQVRSSIGSTPIGVKLSPFSDPLYREQAARLLRDTDVNFVTLCNTFPDVLVYKPNKLPLEHAINSKLPEKTIVVGGLGGSALKPIALAHVKLFREILHPWQEIIGIGGVSCGQDVIEYEESGATIVQLTTAHAARQTKIFGQILTEYISLKES